MEHVQGLGLAIGATLMDLKRATTLASVTVMTFMLAGGFFVKVRAQTRIIIKQSRKLGEIITQDLRFLRMYRCSYHGFGISPSTTTPTNSY